MPKEIQTVLYFGMFAGSCYLLLRKTLIPVKHNKTIATTALFVSMMGLSDLPKAYQNRPVETAPTPHQIATPTPEPRKQEVEDEKVKELTWIEITKDGVRSRLKDPDSAKFRNVRFHRSESLPIVCGEINLKNAFGGFSGFQRFVGSGDTMIYFENEVSDFHILWNKMCVK